MGKPILIEGRNTVRDALNSNKVIKTVSVAESSLKDPKIQEIVALAREKNIPVGTVSAKLLKRGHEYSSSQNIQAEIEIEETSLEEILDSKENPLILIFNSLDYEQNLGAIMRTAWGAGVDAVIVSPSGVHKLTPVVSKVSMGGAVYVPLLAESLFPVLKTLQKRGIPIVGVETGMGEAYTNQNLLGPIAFVFGGEDSGLSEPLKKYCDLFVHIPMNSELSSLNVSVATAIILFEKLRQDRENS